MQCADTAVCRPHLYMCYLLIFASLIIEKNFCVSLHSIHLSRPLSQILSIFLHFASYTPGYYYTFSFVCMLVYAGAHVEARG